MSIFDTMIILAFIGGILSFVNPCTLPIFPVYLSYVTGVSMKELEENKDHRLRGKLLIHAIFFLIGVSLVFLSLGLSVTYLGQWLGKIFVGDTGVFIQRIVGIIIIVMGLVVAGWLTIPTLMKEKRFQFSKKPVGYLGTILVGIGFSAGWTPCIGPIFTSILLIAGSNPTQGVLYTIVYVIGFAIPFLLLTFFIGSTRCIARHREKVLRFAGPAMSGIGTFLVSGQMASISSFIATYVSYSWIIHIENFLGGIC